MPTQTIEQRLADVQLVIDTYLPIPHMFVKEVLGCNTWDRQDDIIISVFKYKLTGVKTSNAVGKTYIAARTVITFLMLHVPSVVVTTAPTWRQVTDILWREIATGIKMSKYKLTSNEVNQAGLTLDTDWYAVGLSTKRPENFFGYHADHILVVVDEAGGVEEPIFKGVAAITPNINARVLYIGNPTNPNGTFYDVFNKPELGANCITISAFQSPNFTANNINNVEDLLRIFTPPEGVPQAEHIATVQKTLKMPFANLIDPSVVYSRYHEWGTDSPAWESLIMGEFPSQSDQALFPANLVSQAMNMYGTDTDSGLSYAELSGWNIPDGNPCYGQDMARFGNDLNVNFARRGGWVEKPTIWNKKGQGKQDLMDSADTILNIINPLDENTIIAIDDTGNGGGTTDRLRQISREQALKGLPAHRYKLIDVNFSRKPSNPDKFHDITSELYWNLRTQFMNKQIALHPDEDLKSQLVGRRWGITPLKKIKVESKDEYKKRTGGKSPDLADALALAYDSKRPSTWDIVTDKEAVKPNVIKEMRPVTAGLNTRY